MIRSLGLSKVTQVCNNPLVYTQFMKRVQLLLTPKQNEEIKRIASKQSVSQSEVVRRLLDQSLNVRGSDVKDAKSEGWMLNLGEFRQENPRIQGFKELYSVGARHPEIKVITQQVFDYYLKKKELPAELPHLLLQSANEMKDLSRTKKLVLRRAYVVPGLENPPGPRFLGVDPEGVESALIELMDFAIKNRYHVSDKSQVVSFMYPFADPEPLALPITMDKKLP